MQTTSARDPGPTGMRPGMGSTISLEFSKPLPDITPDELKQLLSPFLNFSKERSAAVQWFDTLPPEMKKAIQDRRPVVGMDREELIAAIGKPDHKVRERDSDGNDIEDWIYGQPPSQTVFVRFMGNLVTSIKQFPQYRYFPAQPITPAVPLLHATEAQQSFHPLPPREYVRASRCPA